MSRRFQRPHRLPGGFAVKPIMTLATAATKNPPPIQLEPHTKSLST
jgi:hypothetical protein